MAGVDRGGQNDNPMFARIAHNLGGGIKAHGLRVEQRTGKDPRMVPLDPRRGIDQQGKAGRMAFRKAVAAKALDLGKAAGGKVGLIAIGGHALQKAVVKFAD